MLKKMLFSLIALIVLSATSVGFYRLYYEKYERTFNDHDKISWNIRDLDHDIDVGYVSTICDTQITGFEPYVGPSGWPMVDKVKWEVALFENDDYYYARLIYHEYCLWWTWDDPYIVCKIPKCNVNGDLRTDEKLRWQVLWDITYTTERWYDYKPYMPNAIIQRINGHYVAFGNYKCVYYKYFVICDADHMW